MDAAQEQQELRRIERWLTANDPELAAALSEPGAAPRRANRRQVRLTVDVLGAVCVLIGAVTGAFFFIFVGVYALMAGACLHTASRRRRGGSG